jgi:hypothetical protein
MLKAEKSKTKGQALARVSDVISWHNSKKESKRATNDHEWVNPVPQQ